MKVILTQNVQKVGKKHDVVEVADGYALNFLLPKKLAIAATASAINKAKELKENEGIKKEEIVANAAGIKEKIDGKTYELKEKITDKGHLYGSIGEKEVVEILKKEANIELDKSSVKMDAHIKELGEHEVTIKLAEDIEAKVTIKVENIEE